MKCAIEIAEMIQRLEETRIPVPKTFEKDIQRYRLILMATPFQKRLMRERGLSLKDCEALQVNEHLIKYVPIEKMVPLVPHVPGAPLPIQRTACPIIVEELADGSFLIIDGNQWYHRKLKNMTGPCRCVIYPGGSYPVFQHFRLNRHPLSLYVTHLLMQTGMTIGEISFSLNVSYARIAEAFQAVKALPAKELEQAITAKKHITISQLEKVTDPLVKGRGRPKAVPPVNPKDLLEELSSVEEMPDNDGLMAMLVRINQMHRGKALAMATLLCAYCKIPTIQPNHKLVREWLLHLPQFIREKSFQTESESKPS